MEETNFLFFSMRFLCFLYLPDFSFQRNNVFPVIRIYAAVLHEGFQRSEFTKEVSHWLVFWCLFKVVVCDVSDVSTLMFPCDVLF